MNLLICPSGKSEKGQNLLSHPALRYLQSSAAKRQDLAGTNGLHTIIFDGEYIQIEAFELRPVNVRL